MVDISVVLAAPGVVDVVEVMNVVVAGFGFDASWGGGKRTPGALTWALPLMTWQFERQVDMEIF